MQDYELHKSRRQITELLDNVKETLSGLPGFRSLSVFGSLAEGRADEYSDIDIKITTDDLPGAKSQVLNLLEQIGPVESCWVINLRPDEWNRTVVFREESYYHRLDLGLVEGSGVNPANDQAAPLAEGCGAYIPQYGSTGHFLLGQYIGCLRYLKARKRGQTMTCYRFAAAAVDWHLALLYAHLTEDPHFRSKLSTADYLNLDRLLIADDTAALLSNLDFSSPLAMDNTVLAAMERMLKDGLSVAAMSGEVLPTELFKRISAFLAEELHFTT